MRRFVQLVWVVVAVIAVCTALAVIVDADWGTYIRRMLQAM